MLISTANCYCGNSYAWRRRLSLHLGNVSLPSWGFQWAQSHLCKQVILWSISRGISDQVQHLPSPTSIQISLLLVAQRNWEEAVLPLPADWSLARCFTILFHLFPLPYDDDDMAGVYCMGAEALAWFLLGTHTTATANFCHACLTFLKRNSLLIFQAHKNSLYTLVRNLKCVYLIWIVCFLTCKRPLEGNAASISLVIFSLRHRQFGISTPLFQCSVTQETSEVREINGFVFWVQLVWSKLFELRNDPNELSRFRKKMLVLNGKWRSCK